jgi:hypothetical protein
MGIVAVGMGQRPVAADPETIGPLRVVCQLLQDLPPFRHQRVVDLEPFTGPQQCLAAPSQKRQVVVTIPSGAVLRRSSIRQRLSPNSSRLET